MKKTYIGLGIILILGTILRFYHNTDISLWHDEAFSALLIKYSWPEMMYRIGLDVHPPMYYIALRLWHYIFGDSLLALRGFSIFFGVALIAASFQFVKTAFKSEKAAIITALLIAVNPFQIQYTSEARMYTFGAFFAVLGAWSLIRALESLILHNKKPKDAEREHGMILYFVLFALCMGIIILTHYYLLFIAAALCVFALLYALYLYRLKVSKYMWLLISYLLIALSFVPWLKIFLFQYRQVGAGYWIPPMDKWSIPSTLWQIAISPSLDINNKTAQKLVIITTIAIVAIIIAFLRKVANPAKWMVLLAFLAPFGGSLLFLLLAKLKGDSSSVYLVRYFLYTAAFLSMIIAVWLSTLRYRAITIAITLLYVATNLNSFHDYWKELDIKTKPGMAAASNLLTANMKEQDKLFVGSSFEFFNLKYYVSQSKRDDLPKPLLFSGGNPSVSNMPHYAGTAILTDQDLVPYFETAAAQNDTVWLLWTNGFGGSKPTVPANWKQIDEKSYAEVRPYVSTYIYVTEYRVQ